MALEMKALAKQRSRRFRSVILVLETPRRTMPLRPLYRYPKPQLGLAAPKARLLDRLLLGVAGAAVVGLIRLIDRPTHPRRLRRTTLQPDLQPRLQPLP
jgi:hypothetical protein